MSPAPMSYIPLVKCAKCSEKDLTMANGGIRRLHDAKKNQRFIEASCHGEIARIGFAREPGQVVHVFEA